MTKIDSAATNDDSQATLNKIILEHLREQKRKRMGRWIFRLIMLGFILFLTYQLITARGDSVVSQSDPHVGLIDLKGTIFDKQIASSDNFVKSLEKAYKNKSMKALVVRIDSPGGSPVQADYMNSALQYYRKKYPDIKTYAVCVDACASAAYYVAVGVDEIYANPSSLVGSIGVLYSGFGFVDTLQKLGASRRLYTAGQYKSFLDPFLPEQPGSEAKLQTMLDIIHQQFIERVKAGRGARLVIDDETFSGLFWTGAQAKERGLIDGFASTGQLAREIIKIDKLVDYTYQESPFERFAKNIGTAMANKLPEAMGMKPGFQ